MTATLPRPQPTLLACGPPSRVGVGLIVGCWLTLVLVGFVALLRYKGTPGSSLVAASLPVPEDYPEAVSLPHNATRPTLLMFAHPRCPCTVASLGELEAIVTQCPELQPATVIVTLPPGAPADWKLAPIVERTQHLSGLRVVFDEDAVLTKRFGVQTSGHVLLYDASGTRQFSGGITKLRGHEGWSAGRGAIVAICQNRPCDHRVAPVFGCSLFSPAKHSGGTP